jgi:hypothetical protein
MCPGCGQRVQVPGLPPAAKTVLGVLPPPGPVEAVDEVEEVDEVDEVEVVEVVAEKPGGQAVMPAWRCAKVFNPGEHTVEFRLWTVTVVKVDKTVTTDVSGGESSGYLNTDYAGRVYGGFSGSPISTHHNVDWKYWVQDDAGREERLTHIPLAVREGHRLSYVYGRARGKHEWVLVTVVNHTTCAYAGKTLKKRAGKLAEKVPSCEELLERRDEGGPRVFWWVLLGIQLMAFLLLGCCLFVLLLLQKSTPNVKEEGIETILAISLGGGMGALAVGSLAVAFGLSFAHSQHQRVWQLYADEFKAWQQNLDDLIEHCRGVALAAD